MSDSALEAAQSLARRLGLPATDAVILHAGSNVVVHLAPAPVVTRVMTGTAALHADPAAWLGREVSVCSHLAKLGAAIVAPSGEVPPGPHHVDGLWMTCWEFVAVDHAAPAPPPDALGHSMRDLHDALAQVPVELEPLDGIVEELRILIDRSGDPRADTWRAQLATLPAAGYEAGPAAQPLHGDASLSNLLTTTDGRLLWADFEDVCRGPVESDVSGLVYQARRRNLGEGYEAALLSAYGPVDADIIDAQLEVGELYSAVWRARP